MFKWRVSRYIRRGCDWRLVVKLLRKFLVTAVKVQGEMSRLVNDSGGVWESFRDSVKGLLPGMRADGDLLLIDFMCNRDCSTGVTSLGSKLSSRLTPAWISRRARQLHTRLALSVGVFQAEAISPDRSWSWGLSSTSASLTVDSMFGGEPLSWS